MSSQVQVSSFLLVTQVFESRYKFSFIHAEVMRRKCLSSLGH